MAESFLMGDISDEIIEYVDKGGELRSRRTRSCRYGICGGEKREDRPQKEKQYRKCLTLIIPQEQE